MARSAEGSRHRKGIIAAPYVATLDTALVADVETAALDRRPGMTPIKSIVTCLSTAALACHAAKGDPSMSTSTTPVKSGHVATNGLRYSYEIRGRGEPLLHGGLGSIDMFGPVLTKLAEGRQVIGVDLQGHGRTALGDREISLVDIGDDMAAIVRELGYTKVDVLGYSLGAGVAFRFAVQHPTAVRRLVLVSAGFSQDGFYPEMLPLQAQLSGALADAMKGTPMYQSYIKIAPHPEEFPKLLDRMGALMRKPYNWADDVKRLTAPTMLVYGDSDMFRPEHIVEFYHLLGGGLRDAGWGREHISQNRLAIIPDKTHYEIFMAPELAATVIPFLAGKSATNSWAEQVGTAH